MLFAIPHCQVQPSRWVCYSQYLQEWNKVILFQVIAARLGQEVHEFRSVIVTGQQSSGEEKREQMVARLLPLWLLSSLFPFYQSFKSISFTLFYEKVHKCRYNKF